MMDFKGSQFEREIILWAARCTIAGMEVMHAIRKGQLRIPGHALQTPAEPFYVLVAEITRSEDFARLHLNFATGPLSLPHLSPA